MVTNIDDDRIGADDCYPTIFECVDCGYRTSHERAVFRECGMCGETVCEECARCDDEAYYCERCRKERQ